jgi:DNA-binding FadR family transcriptional regulator
MTRGITMSGTDSLKPIRPPRLHEAVEAYLEEMILSRQYQPGDSLPSEHEMAAQLEVSRTVVRDAIRALTTKGLVGIRHGVGTFVTDSGREKLAEALALSLRRGDYSPWELYQVRRGLEMVVVELAVETATEEQIAEMRMALNRHHEQQMGRHVPDGVDEHIRFHQLMVRSTGNRVLMDLLDPITVFRVPESQHLPYASSTAAFLEEYFRVHEAIVDAVERRDLEAARLAMLKHLEVVGERAQRATEEQTRLAIDQPLEL